MHICRARTRLVDEVDALFPEARDLIAVLEAPRSHPCFASTARLSAVERIWLK